MEIKNILSATLISLTVSFPLSAAKVDLRILETTDLHSNMVDFNYYKNEQTEQFGLVRTATLIKDARKEVMNSVLIDNGDLIQGSPLADYVVSRGLKKGERHPVYNAMNKLNYVVGNIGNHEFNYGLDYLKTVLSGANFPYINANIFDVNTGKPYFKPYLIVNTPVQDRQGAKHVIKVGYIGFVPPQIMLWDKINLGGKVIVKDITQTAKELVPQMKQEGADLIIAIAHSGLSSDSYRLLAENSVYYLSEVPDIDAIAFGHAHGVFPGESFAGLKGVDIKQGTINGVPAVMPGSWGDHLGVIDLVLEGETGHWKRVSAKAEARPIYDPKQKKALVVADQELTEALASDHEHTLEFMQQPVGKISQDLYSYLALVQDDAALQIVRDAQTAYVKQQVQGDPDLQDLPVLSAAAPFKVGGRKNNPAEYIEIPQGTITSRNVADIYLYPNTLVTVKATGAEIREWLECSAGMYNQIDPQSDKPQSLLNWSGFRSYNFDMFDGINYQINVTQPARYDGNCVLQNPSAYRIEKLTFQGKPIDHEQVFLVAVNNYRAYTGAFAGTGEKNIAFAAPDEVRAIISNYISRITKQNGQLEPKTHNNWRIAPIDSKQTLDIRVETSPGQKAKEFIAAHAMHPMRFLDTDQTGFAIYRIDLSSQQKAR